MPEKLARSVVVTPCCRHHSLTERPLLRHSWICAAHSCSSARCFNSALVILTSHNTTVAKPFATFRYYCLMCVYARLGLTVTLFSPPAGRKALSYCQPQRGGGGKVLLLLSHKKVTKRLPNRYLYGKMTAVRKRKNRAEERKGERYRNNDFRHDGPGKHPAQ